MSLQSGNKFDLATDLILNTKCNVFLTGKAGTGKTTFLKGLLQECTDKRVVVAPTGIAAINANGVTSCHFTHSSRMHQVCRPKYQIQTKK